MEWQSPRKTEQLARERRIAIINQLSDMVLNHEITTAEYIQACHKPDDELVVIQSTMPSRGDS